MLLTTKMFIEEKLWRDRKIFERTLQVEMSRIKKMKDGARGERKKLRGAIQTRDKKRG